MPVGVVTGAGSGIGRASSVALSRAGWNVILAGRRREFLGETAGLLDGDSLVVPTDVTVPDSVASLFSAVEDWMGRIDLLFNNAGISSPSVPIEDLPFERWTEAVDTNLTGSFLCAQHAVRMMKAQDPQGGRIINNGSISAHSPRPNSAPYTATKHAITGLTRSLALDGRAFNIASGQIDIGNAATDMTKVIAEGLPQADGSIRAEPVMQVEHVASAVAYMASLPLDANVLFLTVTATGMPFVGRG